MNLVIPESSSHWYTKEGKPMHSVECKTKPGQFRSTTVKDAREQGYLPSVTNILSIIAKPGLDAWKQQQAILAALTLPRLEDETLDEFAKRVVSDSREQASHAAERGTKVHNMVETYLTGGRITGDPEIKSLFEPVREWLDKEIIRVYVAESVLVGDGYAGTVDLIAETRTYANAVIDFKTQAVKDGKPKVYPEWGVQLEAYRAACPLIGNPCTLSVVISSETPSPVHVQEWDEDQSEARMNAFRAALALWKWSKNY